MPNRIVKQTGGFYYIDTEEGIIETRARGKFRNDNISPVVGDFVNIAKKHHVDFAIKKDKSTDPPTYMCFFKAASISIVLKPKVSAFFNAW